MENIGFVKEKLIELTNQVMLGVDKWEASELEMRRDMEADRKKIARLESKLIDLEEHSRYLDDRLTTEERRRESYYNRGAPPRPAQVMIEEELEGSRARRDVIITGWLAALYTEEARKDPVYALRSLATVMSGLTLEGRLRTRNGTLAKYITAPCRLLGHELTGRHPPRGAFTDDLTKFIESAKRGVRITHVLKVPLSPDPLEGCLSFSVNQEDVTIQLEDTGDREYPAWNSWVSELGDHLRDLKRLYRVATVVKEHEAGEQKDVINLNRRRESD